MFLVSILGPTSSGKSELAVQLAHFFMAENSLRRVVILSADSRQVYRYLNLGTGKVEGEWGELATYKKCFLYKQIPHFLIDFIDPLKQFSLFDFVNSYCDLFRVWYEEEILPDVVILCGGTGLYAKALMEEMDLWRTSEDVETRRVELSQMPLIQLQKLVSNQKLELNESDWKNPRRLINRVLKTEFVPNYEDSKNKLIYPKYEFKKQFFVNATDLQERVESRLMARLEQGMLQETEQLLKDDKLTLQRLDDLGLEYKVQKKYLQGQINYQQMVDEMLIQNRQYVKRQLTWFKKQASLIPITNLEELVRNIESR